MEIYSFEKEREEQKQQFILLGVQGLIPKTSRDLAMASRYEKLPQHTSERRQRRNGPLSSSHSSGENERTRQSFEGLLDSTAEKPSMVPPEPRTSRNFPERSRVKFYFRIAMGCIAATCVGLFVWEMNSPQYEMKEYPVKFLIQDGDSKAFKLVSQSNPPKRATPVIVMDINGTSRWTVAIPGKQEFPLLPAEYAGLCSASHRLAEHISQESGAHSSHSHFDYYHVDESFIEVDEAEKQWLIPTSLATLSEQQQQTEEKKICNRTLTYVLESTDPGLGHTLMGLWLAYGLAKKEGRDFFIDDRNWYVI